MSKSLLIVESPAKARTIGKYLGQDFEVKASVGHIIDLPKTKLGVNIEDDFAPEYVTIDGKQKVINELKNAAKNKDIIYLGPDPDREGEAIAWHIARALGENKYTFKRVLLHELTPSAIKRALEQPVELSKNRFASQQTRRILDRLMGYLISPLLWDKLKRGLSAGRVQSVALRLVVERERAIYAFVPEEYWTVTATLKKDGQIFEAILTKSSGKKTALKNEEDTLKVLNEIKDQDFQISALVNKERKRHPLPPFTTSTLQQAAFNRFKLASKSTMKIAQELYEGIDIAGEGNIGLITYMRTDSVRINPEAAKEALDHIEKEYGKEYLPKKPNQYKNKKGAQDAHEAIRPSSVNITPDSLKNKLEKNHWQLYDLIWRRFVSSQMSAAIMDQTTIDFDVDKHQFRSNGSIVKFKGFLTVYDPMQDDDKKILPNMELNEKIKPEKITPKQHFTQPPPRFNEATLVKELEEKGIGRPSTYAAIISTLKDKEYVEALKGVLKPTEMGFAVTDLLIASFPQLMDVDFTAGLENNLDQIEEGQASYLEILKKLYDPLAASLETAKENMANLKRDGVLLKGISCPVCHKENCLKMRYGRNGFYLACSECGITRDFERNEKGEPCPLPEPALEEMGTCEKCSRPMVVKKSRYGTFLACSGYPECKNTKSLNQNMEGELVEEVPPPWPEGVSKVCDKCQKELTLKKNRYGSWFISCTGYPDCKNAKPYPSGITCPKEGCGGQIVEKKSKRGSFYGCSNYPACKTIIKNKPVKKECPQCGSPFMLENPKYKSDPDQPEFTCPVKSCPLN